MQHVQSKKDYKRRNREKMEHERKSDAEEAWRTGAKLKRDKNKE